MNNDDCILTINGAPSSIKFSLYKVEEQFEQLFNGEIENIGAKKAKLYFNHTISQQENNLDIKATDYDEVANNLIEWLKKLQGFTSVSTIGHRIVCGMKHTEPELVTDDLFNELKKISLFDPEHLSEEIKLIEVLLGISEINSDMQELIKIEYTNNLAKEAIELLC